MAKPKTQFSRPSIDLGGKEESRREWREVHAADIEVGDTVVDIGLVRSVMRADWHVQLTNVMNDTHSIDYTEPPLRAFVKVK